MNKPRFDGPDHTAPVIVQLERRVHAALDKALEFVRAQGPWAATVAPYVALPIFLFVLARA